MVGRASQEKTVDTRSNGFQKTPLPPDLARPIALLDNARTVLRKRYLRRGDDGQPVETEQEMFWRVAYNIAKAEEEHGGDVEGTARRFYDLLTTLRFFPNSPTFTGAGTPLGQLAACFVLPIDDDMGRTGSGIFETLRHAALIQQTGGGNGFSFSRLRPKGALVRSSSGEATGPVGFLRVYDQAFGEIAQGGCLVPETLVFTAEGALYLGEIVTHGEPGWCPHRLTVATDEGQRESRQVYNNGVAQVLRVRTEEGLELTGTPDHKVKMMTAEGPAWRRLDELQPGDAVLVKLGQHQGQRQALSHPVRRHGNQVMPDLPAVLDEEFAFFLGYLAGDGFVASGDQDHRVGVTVAHSSYLLSEMPALFKRLFGEQMHVHRQQKAHDASTTFWVDNRAVKDFLILNGLHKLSSTQVRVPRLIRQSPPDVVGAYLRGLFEADGSLSHGYPLLMSSSEALLREVAVLLIGLGCPVRIARQPQSADRYGSAPMWLLRVHSFAGLQAWRERIGCDAGSRFAACLDYEPDLSREVTYPLPHAAYWVEPVLEAISLPQIDAHGRGTGKKFRATDPRLRKQLLRYTRGDRQLTLSGYELLSSQHQDFAMHARPVNNLWFVSVAAVEEAGESLTLDLEVDDNHTYLAGGWVTHNSRRGANMAVLCVDHPDIREFITCKTDENAITNFNISVGITNAFMRAVEDDSDFELVNPHDGKVWHTVRARDLFDQIVRQAHHNGEPGVLFLDTANRENPVPHLYELESTNPCFIGSTRIATEHGLLTIAELAELGLPLFVGADNRAPGNDREAPIAGTQGVALRPTSPAWMTRQAAPVLRLTTRKGYSITATPDHRFLTPDGYVALSDLHPGDRVLLQSGEGAWSRNYELPNAATIREEMRSLALAGNDHTVQRRDFVEQYEKVPEYWSHDLGLVMGWLVGDGWVSEGVQRKSIGFAFADDEALALIHEPLSNWFGPGSLVQRGTVRQLTYGYVPFRFFQTLGVSTKRAHEKRLPESIWIAPREAVVGFLQGLFGADGTVGLNPLKQDCTVRLASSSRVLLEDVQILLSNFGIVSRIYQRRSVTNRHMPDGKGGSRLYHSQPQYELVIGKANRDRFAELIGFAHAGKQAKLTAFIAAKKRRSNAETFTDVVLCVEEAGTADVYDLAQPQTHSLIANGLVAHNCGEQFLGPFENCCLGSINLAQHLTPDRRMDWDRLAETVALSTRFLDDVISVNAYVPAVPQLEEAAHRVRRIGLGIMGLADLMYALGVRYGSEEGQEFASQVMEFVRYHSMRTSISLAEEREPFPAIHGSIYDPESLAWQPPQPLVPYTRDWGRPPLDWSLIVEGIKRHGIRNGAQLTVAPTGTISTVAGIEGYGCEPVFALAYTRYVNDNGKQLTLQYTSPQFERALREAGLDDAQIAAIVEQVNLSGTCQDVPGVPDEVRRVFVVSSDVTAEEHVRMQAALQAFTDNAISKTINFPITATEDDVRTAYLLGWKLGCKGMTVYVTGSREKVVLETAETRQKREGSDQPVEQARLFNEDKKPRPRHLEGKTYRVETPLGATYVTVNENGEGKGQPFEIFLHTAKAGSDTAAVAEALGRLISYILRLASPVTPRNRLREIVHQMSGIGGVRSIGFGPHRVGSLPDGVAQVLQEYLDESEEAARQAGDCEAPVPPGQLALHLPTHPLGDLCPECGAATLVREEGCRKCYSCGFSEC